METLTPEDGATYEAQAMQELGPECVRWLATGEGLDRVQGASHGETVDSCEARHGDRLSGPSLHLTDIVLAKRLHHLVPLQRR